MTESEWQNSDKPWPMLTFLLDRTGIPTFRRFALECCRRVLHLIADDQQRERIRDLERLATDEIEDHPIIASAQRSAEQAATWAAYALAASNAADADSFARAAIHAAVVFGPFEAEHDPIATLNKMQFDGRKVEAEWAAQADILRRIVNPFPRNK